MNHHVIADIDTHMGHSLIRRISPLKKYEVAGAGIVGRYRGAEIKKPLGGGAAHIPAGVIDNPAYKTGAVKRRAGIAAAPDIGHPQIFLRFGKHGGEHFILQRIRGNVVVQVILPLGGVGILVRGEQIRAVSQGGHIQSIQTELVLAHDVDREMGQIKNFQLDVADRV